MNGSTKHVAVISNTRYICLGIFAISFVFYLLCSHLMPITDPVESNYALTAKEMVLASDWLSPRIYGNVWFDKPVFFYWITGIAFKIFGVSDLAARLAPAFFAALGLVLMYWFLTKISHQSVAFLAVLIMGTSLEYTVLAKLVITDMVFFLFNSLALGFFYFGYIRMDGSKRWYFVMYISMALAVLTKGPIGVLLPGVVMLIFIGIQRNWAELKEMSIPVGVFLFAAVALPWYFAMYAVHGAVFLDTFLGVHNYLRATVSEHPKDNVGYYYIVVFLLSMLPWSALSIKAFVQGCKELRLKFSPLILFCFVWALTYFIFYSLMATKYLTYTFPILFPVSIITAIYLDKMLAQGKTTPIFYWLGIPLVIVTFAYIIVAYRYLKGLELVVTAGALLLILLITWWQAIAQNTKHVFALLCLCQLAVYAVLSIFVFPAMAESRSEEGLAETIRYYSGHRIGLYQFYSTSSVYYSGNIAVKIEPQKTVSLHQPGSLGWSSKYTMPIRTLANFAAQSPKESILIIVPVEKRGLFLKEAANFNPQLLMNDIEFCYYYFSN